MNDNIMENNPLLTESALPFGAPRFDLIGNEHYLPAFRAGIDEARAEVDAIVDNPAEPDFRNTIEALEFSGRTLDRVSDIFFNLLEAESDDRMQEIAEEVSPMLTGYSMYVSLNDRLFDRVRKVYEQKDSLGLDREQMRLLEETYRSFSRNGAALPADRRKRFSECVEQLSVLSLQFGKNVLAATNAFFLHVTDRDDLDGLPDYVVEMGAAAAAEKGLDGWAYTLDAPSFGPFMKFSRRRELRRKMYMGRSTRAVGGEYDNTGLLKRIVALRIEIASLLGYGTYADYALEERMARNPHTVESFLSRLLEPTLPYARKEVEEITAFARTNGFGDEVLQPWDFPFWSERYQESRFSLNEEMLKPYFQLEKCIDAVLGLAGRLYGLKFAERADLPVYHKDVKVYEVTDESGRHLALFYADFFPRPGKRGGAWMTEFRGQGIRDGVESRPLISIVTNFTKPSPSAPSLLTHSELVTFLHEFGHALHGLMTNVQYESLSGTNVYRDFVELPSQLMENWLPRQEFLATFAHHYLTGEVLPDSLTQKIRDTQRYHVAYQCVRQLTYGLLDMAWHTTEARVDDITAFERNATASTQLLPAIDGTLFSAQFSHIFGGGYAAGYYGYKWAEVLDADAFSLFQEKGIFDRETATSFRKNILEKGDTEDPMSLYVRFRGREPQIDALMQRDGIK